MKYIPFLTLICFSIVNTGCDFHKTKTIRVWQHQTAKDIISAPLIKSGCTDFVGDLKLNIDFQTIFFQCIRLRLLKKTCVCCVCVSAKLYITDKIP